MSTQRADIFMNGKCVGTAYLTGPIVDMINDGATFEIAPGRFPRVKGPAYTSEEVGRLVLIPNPSTPMPRN